MKLLAFILMAGSLGLAIASYILAPKTPETLKFVKFIKIVAVVIAVTLVTMFSLAVFGSNMSIKLF